MIRDLPMSPTRLRLGWKKNSSADLRARSVREKEAGSSCQRIKGEEGRTCPVTASWAGEKRWAERRAAGRLGLRSAGWRKGKLGLGQFLGAFPFFLFIFQILFPKEFWAKQLKIKNRNSKSQKYYAPAWMQNMFIFHKNYLFSRLNAHKNT